MNELQSALEEHTRSDCWTICSDKAESTTSSSDRSSMRRTLSQSNSVSFSNKSSTW